MKCPAIFKKGNKLCGAELQTKRTMANGNKVTRDRYCPRCKSRFATLEQFWIDINKAELFHSEEIQKLEIRISTLSDSLSTYQDLFRGFKQALDKAGKK